MDWINKPCEIFAKKAIIKFGYFKNNEEFLGTIYEEFREVEAEYKRFKKQEKIVLTSIMNKNLYVEDLQVELDALDKVIGSLLFETLQVKSVIEKYKISLESSDFIKYKEPFEENENE